MYEVCAPPVVIIGCCPEYNTAGDVIQGNFLIDCTKFHVPCPKVYNSTDIYKYQKCYGITTTILVEEILSDDEDSDKQIMNPISATQIPTFSLLLRKEIREKSVEGTQSFKLMLWKSLGLMFLVIFSIPFIIITVFKEKIYKIKNVLQNVCLRIKKKH
ncbi:uncharacterized protein LOC134231453 [Saccostrea cucullata]